MMKTIVLHGQQIAGSETTSEPVDGQVLVKTSKGRVRLGVARGGGDRVELPGISTDDMVCVECTNGFKLWMRVDDLYREQAAQTARGPADSTAEVWELEPRFKTVSSERGMAGQVISALEFFGVDVEGFTAETLCKFYEGKQLELTGEGVYQFQLANNKYPLVKRDEIAATAKPILLFIHGTGSSTQGGFGTLWESAGSGDSIWADLWKNYAEACYAFEHRSLTVSPIANALELAKALPDNAKLHLVSHSRGGLVGELLCLGQRQKSPDPLQTELLAQIFDPKIDRTQGALMGFEDIKPQIYTEQKAQLAELLKILDAKQIKVTRFVRVACPALGTSLASGRLDRWLSVLHYVSGANDVVGFLLGVIKKRTDPRTLAGLEAMMPGSALVRLLNDHALAVDADLTVIAGDIEGDSFWGQLKLQLADWFFDGEHDLVVNTGAMYGGLKRREDLARFFFDQGREVSHFTYFKNAKTAQQVKIGLLRADKDQGGFEPLSKARQKAPIRGVRRGSPLTVGPLAIVLHGTMGCHLSKGNERIWLDYLAINSGKMAELDITMPGIECQGLLEDYYGEFIDYLGFSHRVETFAYDWRLSVKASAEKLAVLVASRLEECKAKRQPLRFVAHSMGGLVVRVMFALNPLLWQRFHDLQGSRLLLLGTPNGGSYEAVRWLTGWNPTLNKLGLLDFAHDIAGLVRIVNRYPGLLELLPANDGKNYAQVGFWQALCRGGDPQWPLPQAGDLQKLGEVWALLAQAPIDSERMSYIAGWAPETVGGYDNDVGRGLFSKSRPPVRFYQTSEGDGTVPWVLGRLPGIKTWYVEAAHDQLLAYRPAFAAYLDILQTGATGRLSQNPPAVSRDAAFMGAVVAMSDTVPERIPTEEDLPTFVFGAAPPSKRGKQQYLPAVRVSVLHGNLAYARYPICVGHYFGNTMISAEADLDKLLNGALSRRMSLGLYPGNLNSHAIFLPADDDSDSKQGAIVVGLGRVGELSPGNLASGISQALLDYALKISESPDSRFGIKGTVFPVKISFILIGTGFGGISLRDSIQAILNAVKSANDRLVESHFDDKVLIDEIEFLELYQDVAITAARELAAILREDASRWQACFQWQEQTIKAGSGALRRVVFEADRSWWHHLEIMYDCKEQLLRFITLTDRARAEVTLVAGQIRLADQFIAEMTANTRADKQPAQTLFEMLIPNALKELAPNDYHVVLVLDKDSARFPWELLQDRWSASRKPQSVAAGLVRQLKITDFRARPLHTVEKNALVIGNPFIAKGTDGLGFADLPGAAREATTVASLLDHYGYAVNHALGKQTVGLNARDIMGGLHASAYRILHLAGHGVHEFETRAYAHCQQSCRCCGQQSPDDKKRVSGMVIGNDTFLTPGDIEQMRWVPTLVFINCCYLGSTDVNYPSIESYPALAANLGVQFINMGVKAVVAAGWAVDDSAAKAFAEVFYEHMLSGYSFGFAVWKARRHVYEQFPDTNTWGAYQCYGDPAFCLVENGSGGGEAKEAPKYHSKAEWLADIENTISALHKISDFAEDEGGAWLKELQSYEKRVPDGYLEAWQAEADIAAALGTLYGEQCWYKQAIESLELALAAEKACFSVKALEQLANYRVKYALAYRPSPQDITIVQADKIAAAKKLIGLAIQGLNALEGLTSTIERLSLLGSAYKRLAWFEAIDAAEPTKTAGIIKALQEMCRYYKNAFDKNPESGKINAYPLTNWLTAEIILTWFDATGSDTDWQKNKAAWLGQVISQAEAKEHPEYWDKIVEPDCLLLELLINPPSANDGNGRLASLVESYRTAAQYNASKKDKIALREHVEFLSFMANRAGKVQAEEMLQNLLAQLA